MRCRADARGERREAEALDPGGGAMMRTTGRYWVLAVSLALLLHAGLAVVPLWHAPLSGRQESGVATIEIILGRPGSAPGGVNAENAELPEVEQAAVAGETSVLPAPDAEAPLDAPLREASDEPAETVDTVPAETGAGVEPVTLAVADRLFASIPRPDRKPTLPQPVQRMEPEHGERQVASIRRVQTAEPAAESSSAPPSERAPTQTAVSAVAGSAGKSGVNSGTSGTPGAVADYTAQVRAWLEKHKEYPRRALLRRQQGTAFLFFVMDRDGQVLDHRIAETSGHALLDREVTAMIQRAQPLPRMPDEVPDVRLELVVPVEFFLR